MATSRAPQIAILASGSGTTTEAFVRANANGRIRSTLALVICNNADAGVFDRIASLNREFGLSIQTANISGATHPARPSEIVDSGAQTQAEETAILELLKAANYDLIVLMGYMKRIGPKLVDAFGWHAEYTRPYQAMMLNTHPGLLPETQSSFGLKTQQLTLEKKMPYGGQTLHVVAEDYDDGPVIAEHKVEVLPNDTSESLFARVQAVEKQMLPNDIDVFIKNRQTYLQQGGN